mgnify:CR=1 FL=1
MEKRRPPATIIMPTGKSAQGSVLDKYCLEQYYKREVKCRVIWSRVVSKQLVKVPGHIRDKFMAWALALERIGVLEVRKLPGYHDEPLKGQRTGQRSVRLSRSYRAIYRELPDGTARVIEVIEVTKHDY